MPPSDFLTVRRSLLSIKKETVENTPVFPAATTDFVAMHDDFQMSPDNALIENAELQSSIGRTKPVIGLPTPKFSGTHYLRHSGTEGVAPNYSLIPEGAFGETQAEATQYDTVAASTVSLIKVDTGEGAQFARGQGMLVKDPAAPYSIRAVHSISGNDLTPSFNLASAPGTGVNLGKAVWYAPINVDFPSFSVWQYLANKGALEGITGAKMINTEFDFQAGEAIKMTYSGEGQQYHFNPINIAATDIWIDWEDDDGSFSASITAGLYSPKELARTLQNAMNNSASTETFTVTYSDTTGKFTITCTGTLLTLEWNTGSHTANTIGDKIGFSVAADDSGTAAGTGYTSDNAQSWVAAYTPAYDDTDILIAKDMDVLLGDQTSTSNHECRMAKLSLNLTKQDIMNMAAASGRSGSIITAREVDMSLTLYVKQHDVDKFDRYENNTEARLQLSFGDKVGGNWVAGKCGYIYMPAVTISQFDIDKDGDLAVLNLNARAFVKSGLGEIYMGFL